MATAVFEPASESRLKRYFFPSVALLMLATVLYGFARTYFLAGMVRAPLPNVLIHIHGAAFTTWVLLLITQTSLVAANRVDIHRKLGLAGFGLACVMVILGVLAATDSLRRDGGSHPGLDAKTFYVIPMTDMVIFGTLIAFAYRFRSDPATHKRLILVGTNALMIAAVARWPIAFLQGNPLWAQLFTYVFLLLLAGYDLWTTKKLHRATVWACAFLLIVQLVRVPLGRTGVWQAFATWALNLARRIHG